MKKLEKPVAVLAALALIIVLFVTAFEVVCYSDFDYYRKEYEKYRVLDNVDMEMDDLMDVTGEMMAYLRGDRERLSVETVVGGKTRDFFNDQDRFHMSEVRDLFIGGLRLRTLGIAIAAVSAFLLIGLRTDWKRLLPKAFLWTVAAVLAFVLVIGIFAAVDFDTCFTVFHLIFFDNDLWLFDPATDLMINVLVEEFFMDIALRIALVFAGMLAAVAVFCGAALYLGRKKSRGAAVKALAGVMAAILGAEGLFSLTAAALETPVQELKTEHVDHRFDFPSDWPEAPELTAEAAILYEVNTGTVLYAKNADVELYPASITKIMTGLLVTEYGRMGDVVTYSRDAVINNLEWGAMTVGISVDEQISVKDSLYAMMLSSANDAANGLAEYVSGSNESFAALMNSRAKEIGAYNTHFSNPSGLFDADHYTTCYDMALIMAAAVKNRTLLSVMSTMYYESQPTNKYDKVRNLYQQHKFKKNSTYAYDGFVCGKTGYVDESGNTLVTFCERDGLSLIAVVMKDNNPGHYTDTTALMDYGFDNFKLCRIDGSLLSEGEGVGYPGSSRGLFEKAGFSIEENHDSMIILPKTAELSDVDTSLNYDLSREEQDRGIIAGIIYSYHGMTVGTGSLEFVQAEDSLSDPKRPEESQGSDNTPGGETAADGDEKPKAKEIIVTAAQVMMFVGIVLAVVLVVTALAVYFNPARARARRIRRRRRKRQKNYRLPDDL